MLQCNGVDAYEWIDLGMALCVMLLDMLELGGRAKSFFIPVELSEPLM